MLQAVQKFAKFFVKLHGCKRHPKLEKAFTKPAGKKRDEKHKHSQRGQQGKDKTTRRLENEGQREREVAEDQTSRGPELELFIATYGPIWL